MTHGRSHRMIRPKAVKGDSMFKTIVWATDGSDSADKGLPFVRSLLADDGAVLVVHCVEHVVGPRAGFTVFPNEDELQGKINQQVKELIEEGIEASLKIVSATAGGAAHSIADAAEEAKADLIVVGTRGHTALGGLLLGSVTQRLLHIGVAPVLAVPAVERPASLQPKQVEFAN
jgi:nucleotide-binding universal stress UspA family protein